MLALESEFVRIPAELRAMSVIVVLQQGDVPDTWADIEDLQRDVAYTPATPVEVGIRNFVAECDRLAKRYGKRFKPSKWLRERAERNEPFHPAAQG